MLEEKENGVKKPEIKYDNFFLVDDKNEKQENVPPDEEQCCKRHVELVENEQAGNSLEHLSERKFTEVDETIHLPLHLHDSQDDNKNEMLFLKNEIMFTNDEINRSLEESRNLLAESNTWADFLNQDPPNTKCTDRLNSAFSNIILDPLEAIAPLSIDCLPAELMLKIFAMFAPRDLCTVGSVCSKWFKLSRDASLWQRICWQDYEDVSSHLLCRVIKTWCRHAWLIELVNRCDIPLEDFDVVFVSCPDLQQLSLAFCAQIDDTVLRSMASSCKHLSSLNLEGCSTLSDCSLYTLIGLPITKINLSHIVKLSDEGAIFLVRNFPRLVSINLDGIQWVTDDFIRTLADEQCDSLEELFLDGENLEDESIRLLTKCTKLRWLMFSFCTLMTSTVLDTVSQFRSLERLKLRKGHFENEALVDYLQNLLEVQSKRMRYLNFGECTSINDECLFYIGKRFTNLEELDISWCWDVSDDGMDFVINSCPDMRFLHIQGLHDIYGTGFQRVPSTMPHLTFLDLRQCNKMNDDIIEWMVKQLPNLTVYNYYGDVVYNYQQKQSASSAKTLPL